MTVTPLFKPPVLTGKYVQEVLRSRWLTTGPMCERFREAIVEYFLLEKEEEVVLASSATAGFQGVLDLVRARIAPSRPLLVSMTRATWPGMRWAIYHVEGAHVALKCDVRVVTDIGGDRFSEEDEKIGPEEGKVRVHDACHSWLPEPDADFALMSCYPTKLVPGAEGGVVICKNRQDAEELRTWLYCGVVPGQGSNSKPKVMGRKANMTDVQAALNLEALEGAKKFYIKQIAESWKVLERAAKKLGVQYRQQDIRPYLFQLENVPMDRYKEIRERALERGVQVAWNFPPALLLTVPCYPGIDKKKAEWIVGTVAGIVEEEER